jgi:ligand-binding sensor domain-containing protein
VKAPPPAGGIIGTAYSATPNDVPVCVRPGVMTTIGMTYDQDPGSGRLWISTTISSDPSRVMVAYHAADLTVSGSPVPSVSVTSDSSVNRTASFDLEGNLLMSGTVTIDDVLKWRAQKLGAPVTLPPDVSIGLGGTFPLAMAFDVDTNLWIGVPGGTVIGIDAPGLVTGGIEPYSFVQLLPVGGEVSALAFDKAGNLWAVAGGSSVYQFTPAILKSGQRQPLVALMAPYAGAQSMAFDEQGNLWVGYTYGNHIVQFTPADQAAGAQVPSAEIVPSGAASLTSLAFDETGGLWYPVGLGQIARIPAAAVMGATSGAVTVSPDIVIDGGDQMGTPVSLIFDPAPAVSPINDATP